MRFADFIELFYSKIKGLSGQSPKGFTLPEVSVAILILSIFIIVALTVFSNTYENINRADLDLDLLHEAQMFLSQLGKDIRSAYKISIRRGGFPNSEEVLVLSLPGPPEGDQGKEASIIYLYDPPDGKNLGIMGKVRRIASPSQSGIDLISQDVRSLKFNLNPSQTVVKIELDLEKKMYGITRSLHIDSAYRAGVQ